MKVILFHYRESKKETRQVYPVPTKRPKPAKVHVNAVSSYRGPLVEFWIISTTNAFEKFKVQTNKQDRYIDVAQAVREAAIKAGIKDQRIYVQVS